MKLLTQQQVDQYAEEGATHPIRAFSTERAAHYLAELETGEAKHGADFRRILRTKSHLALKWVDEIAHERAVLDAVEDIIGPDILLYNLTVWLKNARDESYVGWHQDLAYFPLDPLVHITAWIALTDSVEDNGNVKYLPGSHKTGPLTHAGEPGHKSLLSKGQRIVDAVDSSVIKSISLQPGEISLHHTGLVHFSEPNKSARRRIGIGISYIPTSVRCTGSVRHTSMLVRGVDHYNHFDHEPRVRFDFDPEVDAFRKDATERYYAARDEQVRLKSRYEAASAAK